jgi:hypothetical protein
VWTSIVLFVLATAYFVVVGRLHPGREETVLRGTPLNDPADEPGAEPDPGRPSPTTESRGDS